MGPIVLVGSLDGVQDMLTIESCKARLAILRKQLDFGPHNPPLAVLCVCEIERLEDKLRQMNCDEELIQERNLEFPQ